MPIYRYRCPRCTSSVEIFMKASTSEEAPEVNCSECNAVLGRMISKTAKPVVLEYYSEGAGQYFTGPKQRDRILKEKGLEPLPEGTK